jgi:exosome complex component RRP42
MNENETQNFLDAQKIKEAIKKSKRFDNRKFEEVRDFNIDLDIIPSADGSARIKMGNTEIIAGIKFVVGEPYPDNPDEGSIIFNLELSGISGPDYSTGRPSIESIEFGRVADRVIRSSECIDLKKLCIKKGEKTFLVFIDSYVINSDGNLIDAVQYAAMAALLNAKIPKLDDDYNIIEKEYTSQALPIDKNKIPVSFTFEKIDGNLLLDPTYAEENASDVRFSIGVVGNNIVSYHKGKTGTLKVEEINKMMDICVQKYKIIKNKICDLK